MKAGQRLWTRQELILALNLYYKQPFGRLHSRNPEIIHLASLLGRTSGSVAYKLVNFASLDPTLQARDIKGASNASNLDREIWAEFYEHLDILPFEGERMLAQLEHTSVEQLNHIPEEELPREGKERERLVRVRVNQSFFRKTVLASYNAQCCITGMKQKEFLVAGHIMPWSMDEKNRLNPRNGLAINALHDKAFEAGLLTITPDYTILISSSIRKQEGQANFIYFHNFHGKKMILPSKFLPDPEFLKHHNETRFVS